MSRDFMVPATGHLHYKNWHFCVSQPGLWTRPTGGSGGDEVNVKASLGTTRTTCLWRRSSASACSGGLFTTRWHSRELRQRDCWWVWSEDVFNQQDSASLQHGRYYSQKGWKIEKNGICRFPRGLGLKWTGEIVFVWLMRHICVFLEGKLSSAVSLKQMCSNVHTSNKNDRN